MKTDYLSSLVPDWMARVAYRTAYWGARGWWFVRRPRTHGAAVAAWSGGRVLLVKTSYRDRYSLPGGFLRRHERSADAASRELMEEIGVFVPVARLALAWQGTIRFEHHDDTLTIWETDLADPLEVHANRRELVWAGWKTADEAQPLPLQPHLRAYLAERASRTTRASSPDAASPIT
jgi:ADP-ribose pyrophosphatase YjhB (NUDIX family)